MAHIFVGVPMHGGSISAMTHRSLELARQSKQHLISHKVVGLSLLAKNFNTLWIDAYRSNADFFLLHHSDLGVSTFDDHLCWLDILVERLIQLNAAVLSVVSPIKSMAGHLSMGLDLEAGNTHTLRRLTVRELQSLPKYVIGRIHLCELFGIDPRAAGAFIVNTGVLLMDLRRFPWAKLRWPGFQIIDSIEWSLDEQPLSFTEPEDWALSRWLYRHELPYYATRELILEHPGIYNYNNQGFWGEAHDSCPLQPSVEKWHTMLSKNLQ